MRLRAVLMYLLGSTFGLATACETAAPQPVLQGLEPQQGYSDLPTRVRLTGRNFIPSFALDLEQNLRLPQVEGFAAAVVTPLGNLPLRNIVWRSPQLLEAVIDPGLPRSTKPYTVTMTDPRGVQTQLGNGFVSLGPDTVSPVITVETPATRRPLAPGNLLAVRFIAEDPGPGQVAELRYRISWRQRLLVDGRCAIATPGGKNECAFNAMVPEEASAPELFEILLTAIDAAPIGNVAEHRLKFLLVANPTITSIEPTNGSSAGGTDLVVRGDNFFPDARVYVGGKPLIPEGGRWIDAKTITGRTPPGPPGPALVQVSGATGQAKLESPRAFTYLQELAVTDVSPNTAPAGGGAWVVIRGTGFTPDTYLLFGDRPTTASPLLDSVWVDPSEIRGRIPSGTGAAAVWAVDPLLGRARWNGIFQWLPLGEALP